MIEELRALDVPLEWIHGIKKRQALAFGEDITARSMADPAATKTELVDLVAAELPEGYDVETHFTPEYDPWKQRLCLLPDGDLFKAIKSGKASMVTDHIDRFVENGILLSPVRSSRQTLLLAPRALNSAAWAISPLISTVKKSTCQNAGLTAASWSLTFPIWLGSLATFVLHGPCALI